MLSTRVLSLRALSRVPCQASANRCYVMESDQRTRTQDTLKTSSRLTWCVLVSNRRTHHPLILIARTTYLTNSCRLTTTAAIGAAALYYTTSSYTTKSSPPSSTTESSPAPSTTAPASVSPPHDPDAPKPVEDRHGNSVQKHSIAAHKNQNKVREGKFSGKEFDNHVQTHSPGEPGGDFEKKGE